MSSITATDGVPLFLSIREVVDNFFLKSKIVRITSDGGSNLQVCRNAMESKYTNGSIFTTQDPIHHGATCTHIGRGLQGGSAIDQFGWWWGWQKLKSRNMQKCVKQTRRPIRGRRISGKRSFTAASRRITFSHRFLTVLNTWSTHSGPFWTINIQLSISRESCQGFMAISGQGGLPLSTGRSFKWLWLARRAPLAA